MYSLTADAGGLRLRVLGLLAPAVLLLAACGNDTPQAGTDLDLEGSSWLLSSLVVDGAETPSVAESTLVFATEGEVAGSTGCNRFTGAWQQDGTSLTISVGATTLAACASDELNAQERALLDALERTEAVRQSDESLELLDDQQQPVAAYQASLAELAGTSWQATGVNNQSGGVESTALTPTVTAEFGDDGRLTGFSGCRDYSARYEASAGTISVTEIAFDGAECSGDEATLEQNVAAALAASRTYAIEGTSLNLRDSDGATQLNYSLTT